MPARRLPTLLVATLVATLVVQVAAPVANAGAPWARHDRVGGPIGLDTDLVSRSGASAWAINEYLRARTPLPALGSAFMAAERRYGVNARFLLAAAMHESGWGTSDIARYKHNLFGYNAYDRDPYTHASAFRSFAAGILATARFMKESYLTPGGRWWAGRPTLRSMQLYWSSSGSWGESVSRVANSIRLGTLSGRGIRFAGPQVPGTIHGGERVSVSLPWKGGVLPAGLELSATWVPVALDADVVAGTAGDGARARPIAATVRRTKSGDHAVSLSVAGPRQPGNYQLRLGLLDIDGRPLPRADRVAIPPVDVRVWADRAVSVALETATDGDGVSVRITNTGREVIPAVHGWLPTRAGNGPTNGEMEAEASRSLVTVTATGSDPEAPDAVVLLAVPLAADLAPGASVTLDLPGVDAATGRTTNLLAVDLRVLDDPTWLAASMPVGAWRSPTGIGALIRLERAAGTAPAAAGPAGFATVSPAPTPTPAATASPTPTAIPAATPAPVPTATPTADTSTGAHRKRVTRYRSEHGRGVDYRGQWGNAQSSEYLGGNVAWSATPGASVTFGFRGTEVSWIGPLGPTRGRAQVLVDGRVVGSVDLWRSDFVARAVLFRRTFRQDGHHTLTIRVLASPGHQNVSIDAFAVRS
jgi:hypothetical protein